MRLSHGQRGKLIFSKGKHYIIVDDSETHQTQRYTIAHELGHLIIPTSDEYEAERFAIGILAPACVLWGCNIHSAEDIAMICDISQASAKIRAERMKTLYKRNRFLTSPLERQVFDNFSEFIKSISSEKHQPFTHDDIFIGKNSKNFRLDLGNKKGRLKQTSFQHLFYIPFLCRKIYKNTDFSLDKFAYILYNNKCREYIGQTMTLDFIIT